VARWTRQKWFGLEFGQSPQHLPCALPGVVLRSTRPIEATQSEGYITTTKHKKTMEMNESSRKNLLMPQTRHITKYPAYEFAGKLERKVSEKQRVQTCVLSRRVEEASLYWPVSSRHIPRLYKISNLLSSANRLSEETFRVLPCESAFVQS
jgi:hypothetical protein